MKLSTWSKLSSQKSCTVSFLSSISSSLSIASSTWNFVYLRLAEWLLSKFARSSYGFIDCWHLTCFSSIRNEIVSSSFSSMIQLTPWSPSRYCNYLRLGSKLCVAGPNLPCKSEGECRVDEFCLLPLPWLMATSEFVRELLSSLASTPKRIF